MTASPDATPRTTRTRTSRAPQPASGLERLEDFDQQQAWRRALEWRTPAWCREAGAHWEDWSRNGEACIAGLDPPIAGGARLASCLTWLLNAFASQCRRTHDATGAFDLMYAGPGMPSTLDVTMSLSFDLALRDPRLIRERVRRRGGDPASAPWPALWLEGAARDYVIGRDPFPPVGTPRRKLVLLAEKRQVFVPARRGRLAARTRRAWESGLDALAGIDEPLIGLRDEDERAFLVNMLVLVHTHPAARTRPRSPLEDSYRRHAGLIADLSTSALARGLPVEWHALWRLPPGMKWSEPGREPWMRYPAVSFAAAVRPLPLAR